MHGKDEDFQFLSDLIRSGHVRIIEDDGVIVGFAAAQNGWLEHLYVAPAHQRQGHGKRLLADAKSVYANGLKLWVFDANAGAIAFYEREGFKLARVRNAVEADNEEGLADRLYEWRA